MAIPHDEILITIIPDEYHIHFAGRKADGKQVFVTEDLKYDTTVRKTTDFIVVYNWNSKGDFIEAHVKKLGVRGEYNYEEAANIHHHIENSIENFTSETIKVKPCSFEYEGIKFGFIPRTIDGYTVVKVMPGNCLCFIEPFDGGYDT